MTHRLAAAALSASSYDAAFGRCEVFQSLRRLFALSNQQKPEPKSHDNNQFRFDEIAEP